MTDEYLALQALWLPRFKMTPFQFQLTDNKSLLRKIQAEYATSALRTHEVKSLERFTELIMRNATEEERIYMYYKITFSQ